MAIIVSIICTIQCQQNRCLQQEQILKYGIGDVRNSPWLAVFCHLKFVLDISKDMDYCAFNFIGWSNKFLITGGGRILFDHTVLKEVTVKRS